MIDPFFRRNPRRGMRRRPGTAGLTSYGWKRQSCNHFRFSQDAHGPAGTLAFCMHRSGPREGNISSYIPKEIYKISDERFGGWRP